MSSFKRSRSFGGNSSAKYTQGTSRNKSHSHNNGSSYTNFNPSGRETGIIEKLLNTYGFIECCEQDLRIFFHYSEFNGDPQDLKVGDCIEFGVTSDNRSGKPVAVELDVLPRGSVSFEALGEERVDGLIEHEAKNIIKSPKSDASDQVGRVSYDRNGEFFFLPFTLRDVDKGGSLKKGDKVSFFIGTDKRNNSLKARKLVLVESSTATNKVQGIVSSLKDSFGFIERADRVAEIFFHYSEFQGEIGEVMIGDDVQFALQDRKDKEVAVQVRKLAPGTVSFEVISDETYKGCVIKAIPQKPNLRSSMDGQLTGVIEFNFKNDTREVLFGDRDTEDDIALQRGDVATFNISTDRRDGLQRAVNLKLVQVSIKNGQIRETGVVCSLKEGFGFIKCCDRDLSIFFHFSEVVEQSRIMSIGDEVEFTIQEDYHSQRPHATRIRFLPKGTVVFEVVSKQLYQGVVEKEPLGRVGRSPGKVNRENESGEILCTTDGETFQVAYKQRDCTPRETPQYGDIVEFNLVTIKRTGQRVARDVSVLQKSLPARQCGFICALKDTYGFIEFLSHEKEVFFHYSELEEDPNDVNLGDEVEYSFTKKSGKPSAERVKKIPTGTIPQEDILPDVYDGVVVRPLRTMDPEQEEYEGLIEVQKTKDSEESQSEEEARPKMFVFSIMGLVDKKEPLQPGDKVTFQIGVDKTKGRKRAMNISSLRSTIRAKVESVKGEFGFIAYETEEGSNLFFHMSEVEDQGKELQPGDKVEFVIVKCHKNAKQSAIKVRRIVETKRPERLSLKKRQSTLTAPSKFVIIRQPFGPDGSGGFKLKRDVTEDTKLSPSEEA